MNESVCVFCECVSEGVPTEEKSESVSVISSPSVVLFIPANTENLSLTIMDGLCTESGIMCTNVKEHCAQ